jgi:hypothetical protein
MNGRDEKNLEQQVDRALKALPELKAPARLLPRVMEMVAARTARPWYSRSWLEWPAAVRSVSFAVLVLIFAGICFAAWQLTRAAGVTLAMEEVRDAFSGVAALLNTLMVILNALVLAVKHLSTPVLAACVVGLVLAYSACIGLGTVYFKLAFARGSGGNN